MPRSNSNSVTPVKQNEEFVRKTRSTTRISKKRTESLSSTKKHAIKTRNSINFSEHQSKVNIAPAKHNGTGKISGDWEEEHLQKEQVAHIEEAVILNETNKDENIQELNPSDQNKEMVLPDSTTVAKITPERRRLTSELEQTVNSIDILRRDSEHGISLLEKTNTSLRSSKSIKRKKKSSEDRNLRKKLGIILNSDISNTTPPKDMRLSHKTTAERPKIRKRDDSVIVISSGSSAENTPAKPKCDNKIKNKTDLLKHTLTKAYNVKFADISDGDGCGFKRKKMPDFSALHKKQFDKMEDIASMTKRKEERAKLLLSGSKPSPLKTRNNIENPFAKQLFEEKKKTSKVHFTPETRDNSLLQYTLPKTPIPKHLPEVSKEKERRKTKEGFTRYGFKKIIPREQEKRLLALSVANKKKPDIISNKEKRKEMLKGVRTNRRFELLMQMRKGKD